MKKNKFGFMKGDIVLERQAHNLEGQRGQVIEEHKYVINSIGPKRTVLEALDDNGMKTGWTGTRWLVSEADAIINAPSPWGSIFTRWDQFFVLVGKDGWDA